VPARSAALARDLQGPAGEGSPMFAMLAVLGYGFAPVGLLLCLAFADVRDGMTLDELANLAPD
jgi:hypothetical protein